MMDTMPRTPAIQFLGTSTSTVAINLRACFKIAWGPAARDFGRGQDGEDRASPQRAVRSEPTQATDKMPAARRVFAEKAGWLRCSSVRDRCGYPPSSRLAIQPFPRKQDSHGILKQALTNRGMSRAGKPKPWNQRVNQCPKRSVGTSAFSGKMR